LTDSAGEKEGERGREPLGTASRPRLGEARYHPSVPVFRAPLVPSLDLVVAGHDLGVAGRHGAIAAALASALVLVLGPARATGGSAVVVRSTVADVGRGVVLRGTGLLAGLLGVGAVAVAVAVDEDVGDAAALAVLGDGFVLVVRVGELGDDVPCVDEAGDVAKEAEEDVDEGVCGAEAALHPDGEGWEEKGQEAEEDVCGAHCDDCVVYIS